MTPRRAASVAAVALLVLAIGCGDAGSGPSDTAKSDGRLDATTATPPPEAPAQTGSEPGREPPRRPVQPGGGSVSPQSAEFRRYDGDHSLHLSTFGEEANEGRRGEVEAVIGSYLAALEGQEWKTACGLLARQVEVQIAELIGDGGCDRSLALYVRGVLGESDGFAAPEGVSSLRLRAEGNGGKTAGFALFHGKDGNDYWMALEVEGDRWSVLSATPQQFGGSGAPAG